MTEAPPQAAPARTTATTAAAVLLTLTAVTWPVLNAAAAPDNVAFLRQTGQPVVAVVLGTGIAVAVVTALVTPVVVETGHPPGDVRAWCPNHREDVR